MQQDLATRDAVAFEPAYQTETTVAAALVGHLAELGVEQAYGVIGGAIGVLFDALEESPIEVRHFRHESGAAFAAAEAYFASGKPAVVFTTTGPGTLNALTGLTAARWEGAKVILISGSTSAPQRGRWATQETSAYTLPQDALYGTGPLFDFALRLEHAAEFPELARRLSIGLARPGGFVAHVGLPIGLQASRVDLPRHRPRTTLAVPVAPAEEVRYCAGLLQADPFAIWVGFGARHAGDLVLELAQRARARVFCSPRAKGVFPEHHELFVGVTGIGGHSSVAEYMTQMQPRRVLVLGSRLGEATSFWDPDLEPAEGFIHVDVDPTVPGVAYPDCHTHGVQAEIGRFLEALLEHFPRREDEARILAGPHHPRWSELEATAEQDGEPAGVVRPQAVMRAVQRHVIDGSEALVMSECGNAFAWCNHYLRFPAAARYRVSTLFGSMGHCAAGVVGAALARGGKAVAVVGDGSMLMNSEISTAVQYRAPAVWVVLNDAGYGMCESGQRVLGLATGQLSMPCVDFVALARAMGADGARVERAADLDGAFEQAMAAELPFVIDVRVDPGEPSPLMERFESLLKQGSSKSVAGWDL